MLAASSALAADDRKVVIPFDFVSKFDDGRYGQLMGDMLWKKLSREGGFIVPESMLDVRDYCSNHHLKPSPEMDLEKMKKIVQDDFGAHIGIWGSIERAPGEEAEIYDLAGAASCGWSDLAFCGFPLGSLQSPFWYRLLAAIVRLGLPLIPVYSLLLWAAFSLPALALYAVARRRVGP